MKIVNLFASLVFFAVTCSSYASTLQNFAGTYTWDKKRSPDCSEFRLDGYVTVFVKVEGAKVSGDFEEKNESGHVYGEGYLFEFDRIDQGPLTETRKFNGIPIGQVTREVVFEPTLDRIVQMDSFSKFGIVTSKKVTTLDLGLDGAITYVFPKPNYLGPTEPHGPCVFVRAH